MGLVKEFLIIRKVKMKSLLTGIKTHLPVISSILTVVYTALLTGGVFSAKNNVVTLVISVLASLGIVINHVRIQKIKKSTSTVTPVVS